MFRKTFGLVFILLALNSNVFGQENYTLIKEGVKLLEQKKYGEAEAAFKKVIQNNDTIKEAYFNLGNAVYEQGRFDEARSYYQKSIPYFKDKKELAEAHHNIGNSFMGEKKWEESIQSYKSALKNNPTDIDTKYNLAYAQEMLKKEQQQEQENKDQQQENKQDEDKKEDEKKDDKKDENKKEGDKKKDEEKKEDEKGKDTDDKKGDNKPEDSKVQPDKLSKEEADRMLKAIEAQEQKLQDKRKQEEMSPVRIKTDKDW